MPRSFPLGHHASRHASHHDGRLSGQDGRLRAGHGPVGVITAGIWNGGHERAVFAPYRSWRGMQPMMALAPVLLVVKGASGDEGG